LLILLDSCAQKIFSRKGSTADFGRRQSDRVSIVLGFTQPNRKSAGRFGAPLILDIPGLPIVDSYDF
jgi:hypothetical protein